MAPMPFGRPRDGRELVSKFAPVPDCLHKPLMPFPFRLLPNRPTACANEDFFLYGDYFLCELIDSTYMHGGFQ